MAVTTKPNTRSDLARHAVLVHEARKTIKRLRALARLLRYALGDEEFARVNASLRDSGRRLAGARDAEVVMAALDRLLRRHPRALASESVGSLRRELVAERALAAWQADEEEVLGGLQATQREMSRWRIAEYDFDAMAPGLHRVYWDGRRRWRRITGRRRASSKAMHEWRKRVKDLGYVAEMLEHDHTGYIRRLAARGKRLGELLGEEHDLALLAGSVREHEHLFDEDPAAREALLKLIARRRKQLRARSAKLGERLYQRKPGAFIRRVRDDRDR
jgi:CHAD domain-containing protein